MSLTQLCVKYVTCITFGIKMHPHCAQWTPTVWMSLPLVSYITSCSAQNTLLRSSNDNILEVCWWQWTSLSNASAVILCTDSFVFLLTLLSTKWQKMKMKNVTCFLVVVFKCLVLFIGNSKMFSLLTGKYYWTKHISQKRLSLSVMKAPAKTYRPADWA